MSRFNFSDRQSSTLLFATDSLDDMFNLVMSVIQQDGMDGLEGMSLSVRNDESGEYADYDDEELMLTLQALRAKAFVDTHHRVKVPRADRQRWLLRLIGWGQGNHPWTQIPFMKASFLLEKSALEFSGLDYKFTAFSYGPWDYQVTDDLDSLVAQGCLTIRPVPGSKATEYRLTDWGRRRIEHHANEVEDAQRETVVQVATRVTAKHWTEMLRDLYAEFPETAENTILR